MREFCGLVVCALAQALCLLTLSCVWNVCRTTLGKTDFEKRSELDWTTQEVDHDDVVLLSKAMQVSEAEARKMLGGLPQYTYDETAEHS